MLAAPFGCSCRRRGPRGTCTTLVWLSVLWTGMRYVEYAEDVRAVDRRDSGGRLGTGKAGIWRRFRHPPAQAQLAVAGAPFFAACWAGASAVGRIGIAAAVAAAAVAAAAAAADTAAADTAAAVVISASIEVTASGRPRACGGPLPRRRDQ